MHSLQVYKIAHICHTHAYHVPRNMHEAKRYDMHTTWSCCIHTCTCCTHVICMSTAYVHLVYICIHIHAVHIHMCMHGIACCILQDLHSAQCHKHTRIHIYMHAHAGILCRAQIAQMASLIRQLRGQIAQMVSLIRQPRGQIAQMASLVRRSA